MREKVKHLRELKKGEVKVGMNVRVIRGDDSASEGIVTYVYSKDDPDDFGFKYGEYEIMGSFGWTTDGVYLIEELALPEPSPQHNKLPSKSEWEDKHYGHCSCVGLEPVGELVKDVITKGNVSPVKSTGGSSKYYEITLPQWLLDKHDTNGHIMLEDLAEVMFDNDFNYVNVFKAQKRMFDLEQGRGKDGNTLQYDATKCKYYIDKQVEVFNRNRGE